jgi:hypothetical protein
MFIRIAIGLGLLFLAPDLADAGVRSFQKTQTGYWHAGRPVGCRHARWVAVSVYSAPEVGAPAEIRPVVKTPPRAPIHSVIQTFSGSGVSSTEAVDIPGLGR